MIKSPKARQLTDPSISTNNLSRTRAHSAVPGGTSPVMNRNGTSPAQPCVVSYENGKEVDIESNTVSCDDISNKKPRMQVLLLVAIILATWYFYCAYDLQMSLYVRTQKYLAADVKFNSLINTVLMRPLEPYSLEAERETVLKSTFAQIAMTATHESTSHVSEDLQELRSYIDGKVGTKAVLTCITRDDHYGLEVNRYQLEELGRAFQDYRIIIVENDSSKEYRAKLQAWEKENPKVKLISKTFEFKKRPNLGFLGEMRNFYVSEIRKPEYQEFQRVIVFDMDVSHRWPIKDIVASAMVRTSHMGVRCFNVYKDNLGHRDVLAFRSKKHIDEFKYNVFPSSVDAGTLHNVHRVTAEWYREGRSVPVDSCFGGMAVYARDAFVTCQYDATRDECEHLALNECFLQHGLSIHLDTSVAIPFHYRTFKEGLLLTLVAGREVPVLIGALLLGILRAMYSHHFSIGVPITDSADFLRILRAGTFTLVCFVLLAKDRPRQYILVYYLVVLLIEIFCTRVVFHILSKIFSQRNIGNARNWAFLHASSARS
ncbi:Hypothetical Protein FCC1311_033052 [Hondaea fermentalgiana]|uniref:Uncharacterized protein n=1 Tax=Hondaea fermentalgiana TaxID=2315210 RepID=A0A2R5G7Q6_9STRA|nr:Hypothetical Protein FCC1311_033052 [Hondaea fermentalgiana]|eukprot:GBG27082.1 Hypothetical Protein FCC1311_033052 [Hondaea fermentalgiana]